MPTVYAFPTHRQDGEQQCHAGPARPCTTAELPAERRTNNTAEVSSTARQPQERTPASQLNLMAECSGPWSSSQSMVLLEVSLKLRLH